MEKKTVYQSLLTGEVVFTQQEAMQLFNAGHNMQVYYEHNPANSVTWSHDEKEDKNETIYHSVIDVTCNAFNHNGYNAAGIPSLIRQHYDGITFTFTFRYNDLFNVAVSCMPLVDDDIFFELEYSETSYKVSYFELGMMDFNEFDSIMWYLAIGGDLE